MSALRELEHGAECFVERDGRVWRATVAAHYTREDVVQVKSEAAKVFSHRWLHCSFHREDGRSVVASDPARLVVPGLREWREYEERADAPPPAKAAPLKDLMPLWKATHSLREQIKKAPAEKPVPNVVQFRLPYADDEPESVAPPPDLPEGYEPGESINA